MNSDLSRLTFRKSAWRSSRIRSAIRLKPTASAPISSADRTGTAASSSPAATRVVASVSWRTGPRMASDRLISTAMPASHQAERQRQRHEEPAARDPRRRVRLRAHRFLVQAQQPIALRPHRVEARLELAEVDARCDRRTRPGTRRSGGSSRRGRRGWRRPPPRSPGFGDVGGGLVERGVEARAMLGRPGAARGRARRADRTPPPSPAAPGSPSCPARRPPSRSSRR